MNYCVIIQMIHLLFVFEFLQRNLSISVRDFIWPVLVLLLYFFLMVLPLKIAGITIYPMLFDEVIPTIYILGGSLSILGLGFLSALFLQNRKVKRI